MITAIISLLFLITLVLVLGWRALLWLFGLIMLVGIIMSDPQLRGDFVNPEMLSGFIWLAGLMFVLAAIVRWRRRRNQNRIRITRD